MNTIVDTKMILYVRTLQMQVLNGIIKKAAISVYVDIIGLVVAKYWIRPLILLLPELSGVLKFVS
jgi:hypothetical protein